MSSPSPAGTPRKQAYLEIRNGFLSYGSAPIMTNINLSFYPGESVIITGPSGSGKTTLLKMAAGLIHPDRGELHIEGQPFMKLSRQAIQSFRRNTGYLFQDAALWANRSILQNLSLPLEVHRPDLDRTQREQLIRELVSRYSFRDNLNNRPHSLSLGEQKLIAFCRAIICSPGFLFLDEPTTFLDYTLLRTVVKTIAEIKAGGTTVIAATHSPQVANIVADRVVILEDGQITADGSAAAIRQSSAPAAREIVENILLNREEGSDIKREITDETDD